MQSLVFRNGAGKQIDLTSGDFGITDWEGFSANDLNIQSQQVPFQDGAVFLDALMEQRELTVTVAMQDNNDLEKRYELRRQMISTMNPKLGEGVLIYTNDFINKQIRVVPHLPVFQNKNSNDSGTPKAQCSFTACIPYWEDIEETSVTIINGVRKTIENDGDVPCGVEIDLYASGSTLPEVTNITQGKSISINGVQTKNIEINTNLGKKSVNTVDVVLKKVIYNFTVFDMAYSRRAGLYVAVSSGSILTSADLEKWDNYDWSEATSLSKIKYYPDLAVFVLLGNDNKIYKSSDGYNWELVYTADVNINCLNCDGGKVVLGGKWYTVTSTDLVTWTKSEYFGQEITALDYYESAWYAGLNSSSGFIILKSSDGLTWATVYTLSGGETVNSITHNDDMCIVVAGSKFATSADGDNWTIYEGYNQNSRTVSWSEEMGVFVIGGWSDLTFGNTTDGWFRQQITGSYKTSIPYSDGVYLIGSSSAIAFVNNYHTSYRTTTFNSTKGYNTTLKKTVWAEEMGCYYGIPFDETSANTKLYKSTDGVNWTSTAFPGIIGDVIDFVYVNKKLGILRFGSQVYYINIFDCETENFIKSQNFDSLSIPNYKPSLTVVTGYDFDFVYSGISEVTKYSLSSNSFSSLFYSLSLSDGFFAFTQTPNELLAVSVSGNASNFEIYVYSNGQATSFTATDFNNYDISQTFMQCNLAYFRGYYYEIIKDETTIHLKWYSSLANLQNGTTAGTQDIPYAKNLVYSGVCNDYLIIIGEDKIFYQKNTSSSMSSTNISYNMKSIAYSTDVGYMCVGYDSNDNGIAQITQDFVNFSELYNVSQAEYQHVIYNQDNYEFLITGASRGCVYKTIKAVDIEYKGERGTTLTQVACNNGLFIACSSDGKLEKSRDCENWEEGSQLPSMTVNRLNSGNGRFVVVGSNSGNSRPPLFSTDGDNWQSTSDDWSAYYWTDIIWSDYYNKYYATANYNNNGFWQSTLLSSPDCLNWSIVFSMNDYKVNCLAENNGIVSMGGEDGSWWRSIDGVSLDTNGYIPIGSYAVNRMCSAFNAFYALSQSGIYKSEDGKIWRKLNNVSANMNEGDIKYSKELGGIVVSTSDTYVCPDGENFNVLSYENTISFAESDTESLSCFVGIYGKILKTQTKIETNIIDQMTANSDITMGLDIGENTFLVGSASGEVTARIRFRKKYIGV